MTRKNDQGLTDKQAAFCLEYIIDNNGMQAAIRAGFAPTSAKVTACRLLTQANVKARIDRLRDRAARRVDFSMDRLLRECDDMIDAAKHGNPVLDRYGKPTGEHIVAFSGWSKGVEIAGKLTGQMTEKRDTTIRQRTVDKPLSELEAERKELDEQLAELGLGPDGKPLGTQH